MLVKNGQRHKKSTKEKMQSEMYQWCFLQSFQESWSSLKRVAFQGWFHLNSLFWVGTSLTICIRINCSLWYLFINELWVLLASWVNLDKLHYSQSFSIHNSHSYLIGLIWINEIIHVKHLAHSNHSILPLSLFTCVDTYRIAAGIIILMKSERVHCERD